MNLETKKLELVFVINEQLKLVSSIKNELIELKDYEKAALFRDLEKRTENLLEHFKCDKKDNFTLVSFKETYRVNFSKKSIKIISLALEHSSSFVNTRDFVLFYFNHPDEILKSLLEIFNIDIKSLKGKLKSAEIWDVRSKDITSFSSRFYKALKTSELEADYLKKVEITSYIILLCILRNETDKTTRILNQIGLNYNNMSEFLKIES